MSDAEDVKTLIKLLVEIGNEYKDEILSMFEEDISKYTLALIVVDADEQFGFLLRNGRLRYVEGEEARSLMKDATVVTYMYADYLFKIVNSDDWEKACRFGYNVGQIWFDTKDKKLMKHGKNLLKIIKKLNEIVEGK